MRFDWLTRVSLNNLRPLLSLFSEDLAIDLGTTNTRVYALGRGIVVNEPSAVALDDTTGEVQAVGKEAKEMLGRTPGNIRVVTPLRNGVIADFKLTEKMLHYFIQKAHQRKTLVHPRIVISVAFRDHTGGRTSRDGIGLPGPRPQKCTWWNRR